MARAEQIVGELIERGKNEDGVPVWKAMSLLAPAHLPWYL